MEKIKTWLWARLSPAARAGKIKIRAQAGPAREVPPPSALAFLLAGAGGFLLMLRTLEGAAFQALPAFCMAGVSCLLLWWGRRRGVFGKTCLALALLCAGYALLRLEALGGQFAAIGRSLTGSSGGETADVTEAAALLAAAGSVGLGWLELAAGFHLLPLAAAEGLLLLGPLLGFRAELGAAAVLLVFQAGFLALQTPGRKRGARAAALLLAVFLLALPLSLTQLDRLYGAVYALEGQFLRARRELNGSAYAALVDGEISRGNNYHTGARHLILETDRLPAETMYLRGFAGGDYIGGDWSENHDREMMEAVSSSFGWNQVTWVQDIFNRMYFLLNDQTISSRIPQPRQLTIWHGNGEYENRYVPYYSAWGNGRRSGYALQFYEQGELHIDWDSIAPDFWLQSVWCRQMQSLYGVMARNAYTQVPDGRLPRLAALCRENPQESLEDVTAFILYTLHSNTEYTLTPGLAPLNTDIVESFLFDRGRGYCVHYAAAATLMYRLYGIPARYAAGYVVPPERFEPLEDGGFAASVTDESAHAWTEIFLEDYGWVPVEVTPQEAGVAAACYPGVSASRLERLQERRGWDLGIPSFGPRAADRTVRQGEDLALRLELSLPPALVHALWGCGACTLLLLPVLLDWRRLRRLRRVDRGGCRRAFARLLELLDRYRILTGCTGSEPDFAQKLSAALPAIEAADARRLVEAVSQAAYGPAPPGAAEDAFSAALYHRAAEAVCAGLPWYRKLAFRFWYGFG